MSIFEARAGYISDAGFKVPMPDREFLLKALAAIKRRRGLIHGSMKDHERVCALGAFASKHDHSCINARIAEALQTFNDSMPKATTQTRRARVIR